MRAGAYTKGGLNFRKLFDFYDRTRNGVLTFIDFARAIRRDFPSNMHLTDHQVRFVWRMLDMGPLYLPVAARPSEERKRTVDYEDFFAFVNEPAEISLQRYRLRQRRRLRNSEEEVNLIEDYQKNLMYGIKEGEVRTAQRSMGRYAEKGAVSAGASKGVWLSEHAGMPYLHVKQPGSSTERTVALLDTPTAEAMMRWSLRGLRRGW